MATIYRFELVEPSLEEIFIRPWEAKADSRNILLIARREYLEQIRGRAFRHVHHRLAGAVCGHRRPLAMASNSGIGANKHIVVASSNAALANAVRDQLLERQGSRAPTWTSFHPLTPEERTA